MSSIKNNILDFKENVSNLIDAKVELAKLGIQDKFENILVTTLYFLIVTLFALITLIFLSILVAISLNNYFSSSYIGYLLVGVFYGFSLLIWYFAKANVLQTLQKIASKKIDAAFKK